MSVVRLPAKNSTSPFADLQGNHVAVRVPDFEKGVRWYVDKLDFRVVHEWPFADQKLVYLAPANDDNFTVELLAGGDPLPIPKPAYKDLGDSLRQAGYHHFCLVVKNMDETLAELRKRGVTVVAESFYLDAINRKLAFISDPFGNLIELAESVS
jgi:lactoylglutathione lyase/glyoxylase I family protein